MTPRGAPQKERDADTEAQGLLLDIDPFASHDGPGIRTVVYLKGCPLRCPWCHSPEAQSRRPELLYQPERCTGCRQCLEACPEGALSADQAGERILLDRTRCNDCGKCVQACHPGALRLAGTQVNAASLVRDVVKDAPFFRSSGGGVTLSGGEPAMQPEFSRAFLSRCRQRGIHTALETTGYAPWEVMEALAEVTDLILYDLKFADDRLHQRYTGVSNALIVENLARLIGQGRDILMRVPCITGVNDYDEQIRATARLVRRMGLEKIALLPYNASAGAKYRLIDRLFAFPRAQTQSEKKLAALAQVCRSEGLIAQVGG